MNKLLLSASSITVLVMGMNFIFKIYLSHQIDKNSLAVFYTFVDVVSIVLMLFSGFKDTLVKAYDEGMFEKVSFWYLLVVIFGVVASFGVLALFYDNVGLKVALKYFIMFLLLNSAVIFVSYANTAHKNYRVMLFENFVTVVGLIVSFFILKTFLDGFLLVFYSFLGSLIVRLIYLILFKNFSFSLKMTRFDESIKFFFKNSLYSSLMYFFSILFISLSSVVLLKLYHDTNVLGNFQVVVKSIFFSLVAVFVFPLNTYLFPEISKLMSEKRFDVIIHLEKKLLRYLLLFFVFLVVSTFFTKFAISLLYPKEYIDSYKMLNAMLPFLPFIAYTTFALNIIKGANRFDLALIVRVVGSAIFFVVVFLLYFFNFDASYIVVALDGAFVSMAFLSFYYKRLLV